VCIAERCWLEKNWEQCNSAVKQEIKQEVGKTEKLLKIPLKQFGVALVFFQLSGEIDGGMQNDPINEHFNAGLNGELSHCISV